MLLGPAMLLGSLLLLVGTMTAAQRMGQQANGRKLQLQFKHNECSYTFFLPEPQPCGPESSTAGPQPSKMHTRLLFHYQMAKLENALRNSTQRLQKLEKNIQTLFGSGLQQAQQNIVQSHTTPVLELDTSLLNQTTNETVKLTDMESQVLSQMSHMERQMLETSLTTDKLEKQLQKQRGTLDLLHGQSSYLETWLHTLEADQVQLEGLHNEKKNLRQQLDQHSSRLARIQQGLEALRSNSSLLQQQQHQLLQSLQVLKRMVEQNPGTAVQMFQDCEDIRKFGLNKDGVYIILVPSLNQTKRVFCVMDPEGGAWTVIQRREDGSVDFRRNWEDYKQGFGNPAGEHWLGNEVVHQLTSRAKYSLRVEMEDFNGHTFYASFEHFQLGSEKQSYRIFLDKENGMSSPRGHLIIGNNTFSTQDADHDNCDCNCAAVMSGGWWFDACGISNLNGIYYPAGQHKFKINGIRWDRSSPDSTFSLRTSRMMMRPLQS